MGMGKWGLLAGLGQGMSSTGSMLLTEEMERRKEERLQAIRDKEYARNRADQVMDQTSDRAFRKDIIDAEIERNAQLRADQIAREDRIRGEDAATRGKERSEDAGIRRKERSQDRQDDRIAREMAREDAKYAIENKSPKVVTLENPDGLGESAYIVGSGGLVKAPIYDGISPSGSSGSSAQSVDFSNGPMMSLGLTEQDILKQYPNAERVTQRGGVWYVEIGGKTYALGD